MCRDTGQGTTGERTLFGVTEIKDTQIGVPRMSLKGTDGSE